MSEQEKAKDVIDAKKREIENMEIHEVYECVPDMGQKCISRRWVIIEKSKKIIKACFVACGYEEDLHNLKKDCPTCSREAMHLVMLTASVMKWWVETLDFTSTFELSGMLEKEIFLRLPSIVYPESQVWKEKSRIYGLNDAPCSCYKSLNHELTNLKGIVSAYDNALFLWHDATGNLMGILAMYVDNFIFCGNDIFQRNVISELKRIFKVGTHENGTFIFLELGVKQTKNGINHYKQNLCLIYIPNIF